jgi:NADPH-dependent glutamate synthase beta subunit-like oxidoreductase
MRHKLKEIEPAPVLFPDDKVAVIGAGPAGLTVGYDLALKGYPVTVFEQLPVAGGMLQMAIPEYRLPRDVVNDEVDAIKRVGVDIRLGVRMGRDITIGQLKEQGFKAFFLGVGAHKGLIIRMPGGIQMGWIGRRPAGLPYGKINLVEDEAFEKRICIMGDGSWTMKIARRFMGLGAKQVAIIYQGEREQMTANSSEIEAALNEGIQIHFLTSPLRILGEEDRVEGMECIRNRPGGPDTSGQKVPVAIEGSEFVIKCDMIIPAFSQEPELSFIEEEPKFEVGRWNSLKVEERTLATNIPGFFAGGDAVTGPTTLVEAIAAGHRAAVSIDCYLRGKDYSGYWYPKPQLIVDRLELTDEDEKLVRPKMLDLGLDESVALAETRRCLRCDL